MIITSDTSLNDLFEIAVKTINSLSPNEEFIVKDLFRGFEWNRIPKGNRTKLGSLFFSYVNSDKCENVIALDKTAQNQQRYKSTRK